MRAAADHVPSRHEGQGVGRQVLQFRAEISDRALAALRLASALQNCGHSQTTASYRSSSRVVRVHKLELYLREVCEYTPVQQVPSSIVAI